MQTKEVQVTLPTSLVQKESFKAAVKHDIMEGIINPLEFYRRAKLIDSCIEELKKDPDILAYAEEERKKWGKEKPVINGSVIDTGSRTTYDYKACGDKVWEQLKDAIAKREAFLKTIPSEGLILTDQETGEVATIYPPSEKVSEFITVKM